MKGKILIVIGFVTLCLCSCNANEAVQSPNQNKSQGQNQGQGKIQNQTQVQIQNQTGKEDAKKWSVTEEEEIEEPQNKQETVPVADPYFAQAPNIGRGYFYEIVETNFDPYLDYDLQESDIEEMRQILTTAVLGGDEEFWNNYNSPHKFTMDLFDAEGKEELFFFTVDFEGRIFTGEGNIVICEELQQWIERTYEENQDKRKPATDENIEV